MSKSEKIAQLNEEVIKSQIRELAQDTAEETHNELLEAEEEKLTQTTCYVCNERRQGYCNNHYSHSLTTTSGGVTLKASMLKENLL